LRHESAAKRSGAYILRANICHKVGPNSRNTRRPDLTDVARSADLIGAFGTNGAAATSHWVSNGFAEGRSTTAFNAVQYLANYADLAAAFGTDDAAATRHYIANGYGEGRSYLPPGAPADPGPEFALASAKDSDPAPEFLPAAVADEGLIAGYGADQFRTLPFGNFDLEPLADTSDRPADLEIGNHQSFANQLLADAGVQFDWRATPLGDVAWAALP
jgi:hypothetical protein